MSGTFTVKYDSNGTMSVESQVALLRNTVDTLVLQVHQCFETIKQLHTRIESLEREAGSHKVPTPVLPSDQRFYWPTNTQIVSPIGPNSISTTVDERGNPIVNLVNYTMAGNVSLGASNNQREAAIQAMINNTPSPGATPTTIGQVFPSSGSEGIVLPNNISAIPMPPNFNFNPGMQMFDPNALNLATMNSSTHQQNNFNKNNNPQNMQTFVLDPSRATNELLDHVCLRPWIKELCLKGCKGITNFAPISRLRILWKLSLQGCSMYVDDSVVKLIATHNKRLSRLNLCGCERVTDATPLAQLSYLFDLNLSGCYIKNDSLEAISNGCNQLSRLAINSCPQITDISCISKLKELKLLYCRYSDGIAPSGISEVIHSIGHTLLTLNVDGIVFKELMINDSTTPIVIKNINFKDNTEMVSLQWLFKDTSRLQGLEMLDVEGCINLQDLGNACNVPTLKTMRLTGTAIDDHTIERIANGVPALTSLSVEGCTKLKSFHPLQNHKGLAKIFVDQQQYDDRNSNGLAELNRVEVVVYSTARRPDGNPGELNS